MAEPRRYDLAIVGAGPAGMAAAVFAADGGLRVVLLDAGRQLGGQFYRHPPEGLDEPWAAELHHGWEEYERLAADIEGSRRIDVLFEHEVWALERGFTVHTDRGRIEAANVLLATGSYERVLPFPGWDLPGVYTPGGAQALLKGSLVAVGRRVVVAGTGPLLLPVAAGLRAAGAEVVGLFEAGHFRGYARHPGALLTNPRKLAEGADYAWQLAKARVRPRSGFLVVAAEGKDALEAVVVARADGSGRRRIECDALAVGYGLAPQADLGLALGCDHTVFSDGSVGLRVDDNQRTSVPGLYAAGEAVGVAGVQAALIEGELAGRYVSRYGTRGVINSLKRRRARQRGFADVIRSAHPIPPNWRDAVTPETLVCRCEEVPAAAVTEAATDLGAADARTVKLLTRAGMGWCQGRMCGYAVACLGRSDRYGQPSPQDLLAAARRPMSRPVSLAVLAAYDERGVAEDQAADDAAVAAAASAAVAAASSASVVADAGAERAPAAEAVPAGADVEEIDVLAAFDVVAEPAPKAKPKPKPKAARKPKPAPEPAAEPDVEPVPEPEPAPKSEPDLEAASEPEPTQASEPAPPSDPEPPAASEPGHKLDPEPGSAHEPEPLPD